MKIDEPGVRAHHRPMNHIVKAPPTDETDAARRRQALRAQWREENRQALESSNAYVETYGLPLEQYRRF